MSTEHAQSGQVYNVGDMARLAGVSVRMLRHYDEIGLLPPLRVDPRTSYRLYGPAELNRLRRIVTFRELGFPLSQVAALLEESIGTAELRGMLRLRQSQIAEEIDAHCVRLQRLAQLIATLEQDSIMSTLPDDAVSRVHIPRLTVATVTAVAAGFGPAIGPVLSPLFPQVFSALRTAGVTSIAPPLSLYDEHAEGVAVSAAAPIDSASAAALAVSNHVTLRELPPIDAVTTLHRGSVATIDSTYQALMGWIADHGLQTVGYSREVNLECPSDPNEWVTEIQFEVRPVDS